MKLKAGKNDGDLGLSSDYFIHAYNELSVHIAFLFSGLIVHGFAPNDMLVSTVVPIQKEEKRILWIRQIIEASPWVRFLANYLI